VQVQHDALGGGGASPAAPPPAVAADKAAPAIEPAKDAPKAPAGAVK